MKLLSKLFSVTLLICASFINAKAAVKEFTGTVSKKEGEVLTIPFESDWAPVAGDLVTISTTIAGRVLSGGKAEVTEVGQGFVKAKVLSGKPNIRMNAVIVSENPVPANLSTEDTYAEALKLYEQALKPGTDMFKWFTGLDTKSEAYQAAMPIMKKAAEKGHIEANYLYAKHFEFTTYEPLGTHQENYKNPWLHAAADKGFAPAQYRLGYAYSVGFTVEKDDAKAEALLRKAADQGFVQAVFALGNVVKDPKEAKALKFKAAEAGFVEAQLWAGKQYVMFPDGDGMAPYNLAEGIEWLEKASDQGSTTAMMQLGDLYFNGGIFFPYHEKDKTNYLRKNIFSSEELDRHFASMKIPKDLAKAKHHYTMAAESNHFEDPYHQLGKLHSQPESEFFDETTATDWFKKGAEKNRALCIIQLSRRYRLGLGTEANPDKAFELASSAVEKYSGVNEGFIELAICYRDGIGTTVDYQKAMELLRQVAEKDFRTSFRAMVYIGDLYRHGMGSHQDFISAHYWYQKAVKVEPSRFKGDDNETTKAMAHARLARAYAYGEGVTQNMNEVFEHSSAALRLDPKQALALRCGGLFLDSFKEKENKLKAAKVFEQAADLGDIESSFLLGEMYAKGSGVKRDKDTAIDHYQSAARAGHKKSQAALQKLKVSW